MTRRVLAALQRGSIAVGVAILMLLAMELTIYALNLLDTRPALGDPRIGFGLAGKRPDDDSQAKDYPHDNSRGFKTRRTVSEILQHPAALTIAVVGDSHTDLDRTAVPLSKQHPFVLEGLLRRAFDAEVLHAGVGKFSPLQEYLLFKYYLKDAFRPQILILNLYTGNDFFDLLRPDDRPHFDAAESGEISIRAPEWVVYANPGGASLSDRSALLGLMRDALLRLGQPKPLTRLRFLLKSAREEEANYRVVFSYVADVRRSLEPRLRYPGAYSAQVLNQALFLKKHFPHSAARSRRLFRHLLRLMKEENPGLTIVVSAIPSAVLADRVPHDTYFGDTLRRVGMSRHDVVQLERTLYEDARGATKEEGFVFVDILRAFMESRETAELFNGSDLHVTDVACEVIAEEQARMLAEMAGLPLGFRGSRVPAPTDDF
jgi:hypothetical protein